MMAGEPNVGQTPTENAARDAIHVAVIPVTASHLLIRGDRVNIDAKGEAYKTLRLQDGIGVVDPFKAEATHAGEKFWLFLNPGTITSLRHVWTHPAFTAKPLEEVK